MVCRSCSSQRRQSTRPASAALRFTERILRCELYFSGLHQLHLLNLRDGGAHVLCRVPVIRLAALLLVIFPLAAFIEAQERAYLDATQVQIRQRQREPATGSFGVIGSAKEGQKPPPQPLTLTLKILGRSELARGEAFDYEVQIRNVHDQPIQMAWDLSPADIEPTDPRAGYQYQSAAILLNAKLGENRAVSLEGSILLFGTPSLASTMIRLEPGQWVRIKGKGRALAQNPNDAWPPPDLVSKQVEGTLEARLVLSVRSLSPGTGGNSHEDSRITTEPISSTPYKVQFRF